VIGFITLTICDGVGMKSIRINNWQSLRRIMSRWSSCFW